MINVTIEIACSMESPWDAVERAKKLEKEGFIPIGIAGVPKVTVDRRVPGTCILMYKR